MPRIFDNIDLTLVSALRDNLPAARRVDVSVGYFNLRGWRLIDRLIEELPGSEGSCCRLIVGMQRSPQEELRHTLSLSKDGERMSNKEARRLVRAATEEFRQQLQIGAPTDADEAGLRRLSAQLRSKKLVVKLHLRHPLHAKLYLVHRDDPNLPAVGFVGSSNLTPSGLMRQGELNVDVLDHDSTQKLSQGFEDRWQDRWCVDISEQLADLRREHKLPVLVERTGLQLLLRLARTVGRQCLHGAGRGKLSRAFLGSFRSHEPEPRTVAHPREVAPYPERSDPVELQAVHPSSKSSPRRKPVITATSC